LCQDPYDKDYEEIDTIYEAIERMDEKHKEYSVSEKNWNAIVKIAGTYLPSNSQT